MDIFNVIKYTKTILLVKMITRDHIVYAVLACLYASLTFALEEDPRGYVVYCPCMGKSSIPSGKEVLNLYDVQQCQNGRSHGTISYIS